MGPTMNHQGDPQRFPTTKMQLAPGWPQRWLVENLWNVLWEIHGPCRVLPPLTAKFRPLLAERPIGDFGGLQLGVQPCLLISCLTMSLGGLTASLFGATVARFTQCLFHISQVGKGVILTINLWLRLCPSGQGRLTCTQGPQHSGFNLSPNWYLLCPAD